MKNLVIAFFAVALFSGPFFVTKTISVAQTYTQDVADILDPSLPKLT